MPKARIIGAALALGLLVWAGSATAADDCDRACLTGFVDQYVTALVARDPSSLPVVPDVKFTENLVPLEFGEEGLWRTVIGRRDYNLYAADPETGNVAWYGIMRENGTPVMMALRLKIEDRAITEVETVVGRIGLNHAGEVVGPRPGLTETVPPNKRVSREAMIAIASSNWDAMAKGNGNLAPYAPECERYDNGGKMTGDVDYKETDGAESISDIGQFGCFGQMHSGRFVNGHVTDPRRPWVVDEEKGLVVGLYTPNVPGDVKEISLRSGATVEVGKSELQPFTIVQAEMFKIVDGRITMVEVVLGPRVPYGMRSPFDMKNKWERW